MRKTFCLGSRLLTMMKLLLLVKVAADNILNVNFSFVSLIIASFFRLKVRAREEGGEGGSCMKPEMSLIYHGTITRCFEYTGF